MRERKLRSGLQWLVALEQKGVKQELGVMVTKVGEQGRKMWNDMLNIRRWHDGIQSRDTTGMLTSSTINSMMEWNTIHILILRCQLYMFRTVTVHPQELLFKCCMCRLWYVLVQRLRKNCSSSNVVPAGCISTYHSLHIQHLKRSSWGWTVTVRNM